MNTQLVKQAIADIQQGKMVILLDDCKRENEGDLVIAAEKITAEHVNFMIQHARGLVCMPMTAYDFKRLDIPMMVQNNQSTFQTGFGVSIGAATDITTGISAFDRAHTIRVAANPQSTAKDIVKPGHIFPLRARDEGVFVRPGHTEASVDLMKAAGLYPSAVVCEIMNSNGSMARKNELEEFAKKHQLTMLSVQDIFDYRLLTEQCVTRMASVSLPTQYADHLMIHVYRNPIDSFDWIAITSKQILDETTPLVRMHSQCITGDLFHSKRCDCGEQFETALQTITHSGGILLYLPQEGRGIGLVNKIKAYALQDQGLDTVEANHQLGFQADHRHYWMAAKMLQDLGVHRIRLMTNNPQKITELNAMGIEVIERIPMIHEPTVENQLYLQTKQKKLGHWLEL